MTDVEIVSYPVIFYLFIIVKEKIDKMSACEVDWDENGFDLHDVYNKIRIIVVCTTFMVLLFKGGWMGSGWGFYHWKLKQYLIFHILVEISSNFTFFQVLNFQYMARNHFQMTTGKLYCPPAMLIITSWKYTYSTAILSSNFYSEISFLSNPFHVGSNLVCL